MPNARIALSSAVEPSTDPRPGGRLEDTRERVGDRDRSAWNQARASSDLPASLEASRSNRRRISPRRRMLAGLRACELSGFGPGS